MKVGAHPLARPRAPSSAMVTEKPLKMPGYFLESTCIRHFTRSRGTMAVWVIPQDKIPPSPHSRKYWLEPNSQLSPASTAAADTVRPFTKLCDAEGSSGWHCATVKGLKNGFFLAASNMFWSILIGFDGTLT
ncbi:hypothetical protein FOCC_FOCC000500 [Frankliniella occidentalis]|nr:hypothetical protein FOCC_FOCC000500 [Frankliniella occidentalis]